MVFEYLSELSGVLVGIITTISAAMLLFASKTRSDKELAETRRLVADDVIGLKDEKISMLEASNAELRSEVDSLTSKLRSVEERLAVVTDTLLTAIASSGICIEASTCPNRRHPAGGESVC